MKAASTIRKKICELKKDIAMQDTDSSLGWQSYKELSTAIHYLEWALKGVR